jgi:hypothetical protein
MAPGEDLLIFGKPKVFATPTGKRLLLEMDSM